MEISATDLALRTVVAPEMIEGGTELGPMLMAGAFMPYKAAKGMVG